MGGWFVFGDVAVVARAGRVEVGVGGDDFGDEVVGDVFKVGLLGSGGEEGFVVLEVREVVGMVLEVGLEFGRGEDFGFELFDASFADQGFGDGFEGVADTVAEAFDG